MSSLSEMMLKTSKAEEIKKLQSTVKMELMLGSLPISHLECSQTLEERYLIRFSTRYWDWHPFHYSEIPDADTGDLFLSPEDFSSSRVHEMQVAFKLLDELINFIKNYKVSEIEELASLVAN